MKSFFIGRPQGGDCQHCLRSRRFVALLAAAGLLAGVAIAQSYRSGSLRAFPTETTDTSAQDSIPGRKIGDFPACEDPQPPAAAAVKTSTAPLLSVPAERNQATLRDAISLAEQAQTALQDVSDYTALFTKTERINGRLKKQVMEMKLRQKPFSVYLFYRSKREDGRKAIFVAGRHDDKLVVKDVGIRAALGTLEMNLQNPLVTCENRYPVTELGISKVVETALTNWTREEKLRGVQVVVTIADGALPGAPDCYRVEVTHHNRLPEIEYQTARLLFDKRSKLPIHVERYGWPESAGEEPPLMEEYDYSNVHTNVGLTDADFDPQRQGL
jgi:hypothetical protein